VTIKIGMSDKRASKIMMLIRVQRSQNILLALAHLI